MAKYLNFQQIQPQFQQEEEKIKFIDCDDNDYDFYHHHCQVSNYIYHYPNYLLNLNSSNQFIDYFVSKIKGDLIKSEIIEKDPKKFNSFNFIYDKKLKMNNITIPNSEVLFSSPLLFKLLFKKTRKPRKNCKEIGSFQLPLNVSFLKNNELFIQSKGSLLKKIQSKTSSSLSTFSLNRHSTKKTSKRFKFPTGKVEVYLMFNNMIFEKPIIKNGSLITQDALNKRKKNHKKNKNIKNNNNNNNNNNSINNNINNNYSNIINHMNINLNDDFNNNYFNNTILNSNMYRQRISL